MTGVELIGLGLLVAVVLLIALLAVRRSSLARTGSFDLCWRTEVRRGGAGWVLGQGRYAGDRIDLFRSFSVLPMPSRTLSRRTLVLGPRRAAEGTEPDLLPLESVILRCRNAGRDLELAMSEDALTGLRSWLESAPSTSPGPTLGG